MFVDTSVVAEKTRDLFCVTIHRLTMALLRRAAIVLKMQAKRRRGSSRIFFFNLIYFFPEFSKAFCFLAWLLRDDIQSARADIFFFTAVSTFWISSDQLLQRLHVWVPDFHMISRIRSSLTVHFLLATLFQSLEHVKLVFTCTKTISERKKQLGTGKWKFMKATLW